MGLRLKATALTLSSLLFVSTVFGGGLLKAKRGEAGPSPAEPNEVHYKCISKGVTSGDILPLTRRKPWSLPTQALSQAFDTTINCLVLRYNFQYETTDDPNTTGRGVMDLSPHPIPNAYNTATPADSIAYLNSVGHFIDPPPHDSIYFDRQMRALRTYWEKVSHGKVTLAWDIFPPGKDSVYTLPNEMSFYGKCDFTQVISGLENYFRDCIQLADTAHLFIPGHPDIDFSKYQSIFLFHAGADGQNDIGFPPTCSDLFTGFIRFGQPIPVDNGANLAGTALMMPEAASQDNRSTALNAVIAHEFGHQLGLVDLYSTRTFLSQLGDFALMDNNGFGSGVTFGWPAGNSFGTIPLFPMAWSRAFLGFEPVVDFRQGQDIRVVAAEVVTQGIQLARVPISETEYYLIENRLRDFDGVPEPGIQFDTITNVILGPARNGFDSLGNPGIIQNGEYDFLIPGDGLMIYHVDEAVAALDFDNDGLDNFSDNQLQLDKDRRFIRIVEADGLVNFGGNFRSGFGSADDMFRDDRNNSFTPNTNPAAIDNSGNNTRVFLTNIRRAPDTTLPKQPLMDSVILFSVETDKLVPNFPVRCGLPQLGLSPIADDLDGDGIDEVIVASGDLLSVFTSGGEDFLRKIDPCSTCSVYVDTFVTSINRLNSLQPLKGYPVPLYRKTVRTITAGPVTGSFVDDSLNRYVVIAFPLDSLGVNNLVEVLHSIDADNNGQADPISGFNGSGLPIAASFGDVLWILTSNGEVYKQDSLSVVPTAPFVTLAHDSYYGTCRIGKAFVVTAADTSGGNVTTTVTIIDDSTYTYAISGDYQLGPVSADLDRDGLPELILFSALGDGIYVTVDTTGGGYSFEVLKTRSTGYRMTVSPSIADIDLDGFADVLLPGGDSIYAFDRNMLLVTDFPLEVDDRHLDKNIISRITIADIQRGGSPELISSSEAGNIYAWGDELAYGFPVNSGEQQAPFSNSAAVLFNDSTGGKLGYLGGDGWFYAWEVDADTTSNFWPMGNGDASATNSFSTSKLGTVVSQVASFSEEQFYNYPNPVTSGLTTIRYYLGKAAQSVTLSIYDLSGQEITSLAGTAIGNAQNEVQWDCQDVTPGVYRCIIDIDFGDETVNAFTDIAVIR